MADNIISFVNPGEIDYRVISTMGVNVKESHNPIGYFGTGLKYAIAVLLREGQKIEIWSGEQKLEFGLEPLNIRGKDFQQIYMRRGNTDILLGFTTELGKNWNLQNAYRELYCNSVDEGGATVDIPVLPFANQTIVKVTGAKFTQVHRERREFLLLDRKKLFEIEGVGEIYEGQGREIFYRGIAVGKAVGGHSSYTYNISAPLVLTEDRTIKDEYQARAKCCQLLGACASPDIIRTSLDHKGQAEDHFYFSWSEQGETFYRVIEELMQSHQTKDLNQEAVSAYIKAKGRPKQKRRALEMTEEEQGMLQIVVDFWENLGYDIREFPIRYVHSLSQVEGVRVYAQAEDGQIWLTPECFSGMKLLKLAVFEEFVHLKHGVSDESREMQNLLFQTILQMGEKLQGDKPIVEGSITARFFSPVPHFVELDKSDEIPF